MAEAGYATLNYVRLMKTSEVLCVRVQAKTPLVGPAWCRHVGAPRSHQCGAISDPSGHPS